MFFRAWFLLPLFAIALRTGGLKRLQRALSRTRNIPFAPADLDRASRVALIVDRAAHYGYRATCLERSLLLWWLLRRYGIESDLQIGVRKENGNFEAHAWIELDGAVLNDRADVGERFAVFAGAMDAALARVQIR